MTGVWDGEWSQDRHAECGQLRPVGLDGGQGEARLVCQLHSPQQVRLGAAAACGPQTQRPQHLDLGSLQRLSRELPGPQPRLVTTGPSGFEVPASWDDQPLVSWLCSLQWALWAVQL